MWEVGYQNGQPVLGDALDVELAAQFPGEPGRLCKALLECRLIDQLEDGRLQIHDLHENAPNYVKDRAQKENERKKPKTCQSCGGPYHSGETHAKFCSPACRVAHFRARSVTDDNGGVRYSNAQETRANEPPSPAQPIKEDAAHPSRDKPATKSKKKLTEKKPRPPDPLWDAIVHVTGADTSIKSQAAHVGKVRRELAESDPPYTAEDVLALPAAIQAEDYTFALTLGAIPKHIHLVRTKHPAQRKSEEERQRRSNDQLARLRADHHNASKTALSLTERAGLQNGRDESCPK
jgi:hypothetical protein